MVKCKNRCNRVYFQVSPDTTFLENRDVLRLKKLLLAPVFDSYDQTNYLWSICSIRKHANHLGGGKRNTKKQRIFADPTRCQWLYPPCALRQKVATLFSVTYAETFFTQPYNGFLEMKIVTPVKVDSWPRKVNV